MQDFSSLSARGPVRLNGRDLSGRPMMMPLFMGAPWVPKFSSTGSKIKFGEWRSQVETMLGFQPIRDSEKADLVLGL